MTTVTQMTKGELKEMIEAAIEQKLLGLLDDPDERLLLQKQATGASELCTASAP